MVYYVGTYSGYSLQHHGVKGQKWGVRRYQNPDGSLTAAGKKRYDTKQARELVRTAKKEYRQVLKRHNDEGIVNWHKNQDVVKSFGKLQNEKKNFALIKAREKKNAKRLKYEEHYRQKGLSPEEAEIAAYKRQRTQKILAVTAGVAITAAAAYVAYKHYDRNVDKFIKEGTIYKRVARTPDTSVHDAFFASTGKKDPIKYKGYWGSTIEGFDGGFGGVYSKDIVVDKGIKVASEKSARNVFSGLMRSDPEFRTNFKNVLDHEYQNIDRMKKGSYKKALREAKKAFESNNYDNKYLYRVMNANIPSLDGEHGAKRFYSELRKRGFGALEDLNDRWYSGYDTRTAKIFIDKGRVHVDNVHRMFSKELEANFKAARKIDSQSVKERTKDFISLLESSAVSAAPLLPGLSIVGAASAYSNKKQSQASKSKETQVIRDYRKDHPNSKLSDDDILRNYYG